MTTSPSPSSAGDSSWPELDDEYEIGALIYPYTNVYSAREKTSSCAVVVKVKKYDPALEPTAGDENVPPSRLKRESEILQSLRPDADDNGCDRPALLKTCGRIRMPSNQKVRHCLVLEKITGTFLHQEISRLSDLRKQFDKERILQFIKGTTFALEHIHEKNVWHLDLKPEHIVLVHSPAHNRDFIRLLDFGNAMIAGDSTRDTERGTLEYESPEQFNNKPASARSDLFTLGLIVFQMLTCKHITEIRQIINAPDDSQEKDERVLAMIPEGFPRERLTTFILKATRRDVTARYESAQEFRDKFVEALFDMAPGLHPSANTISANQPSAPAKQSANQPVEPANKSTTSEVPKRQWTPTKTSLGIIGVTLVGLSLFFVVAKFWPKENANSPEAQAAASASAQPSAAAAPTAPPSDTVASNEKTSNTPSPQSTAAPTTSNFTNLTPTGSTGPNEPASRSPTTKSLTGTLPGGSGSKERKEGIDSKSSGSGDVAIVGTSGRELPAGKPETYGGVDIPGGVLPPPRKGP